MLTHIMKVSVRKSK